MKGILSYSGITAKVRAMEGKRLDTEQYKIMAALESVPEAVSFLKTLPPYESTFSNLDDDSLHRSIIERLLTDSLYRDYTKLYRFSNLKQRQFLDFYFQHFEIDILKNCLRNAVAHQPASLGLAKHEEFFKRHSKIDLIRLSTSSDLDEFVANLEGTPYYDVVYKMKDSGDTDPFDYEMAMDLYYFGHAWRHIKKKIPKGEQDSILQCFGSKLDLLNLQWIYRMKKYYSIPADLLRSLLIPIHLRLREDTLSRLINAERMEDFFAELKETWYGSRLRESGLSERPDLEILSRMILNRVYRNASKKNPYSIATLASYLYFKEEELQKIVMIIESIRYSVDINEILEYIDQH